MALEDYPFRVEELSPRGELIRVLVYADSAVDSGGRAANGTGTGALLLGMGERRG